MRNDDLIAAIENGMRCSDAAREFGICKQRVSQLWHRYRGDLPLPPAPDTFTARFWDRVDKSGDCWPWIGSRQVNGYGHVRSQNRSLYAHRVAWTLANGPIPPGLWVLHRCDNPPCVNPSHLFLGTARDNTLDSIAKGRWAIGHHHLGRSASCRKGHERTTANVQPNGACRPCSRLRGRRYRARRSALASTV